MKSVVEGGGMKEGPMSHRGNTMLSRVEVGILLKEWMGDQVTTMSEYICGNCDKRSFNILIIHDIIIIV